MEKRVKDAIVVGIGHPMLKDHRVGIEVVEALNASNPELETAILHFGGKDVLDIIMGYEKAIIVDACQIGMRPGAVIEITPEKILDNENLTDASVNALESTLKTGQTLFPDQMPKDLKLFLVEVEDISPFSIKCTPVVCHAINDVVERIQESFIGGWGQLHQGLAKANTNSELAFPLERFNVRFSDTLNRKLKTYAQAIGILRP